MFPVCSPTIDDYYPNLGFVSRVARHCSPRILRPRTGTKLQFTSGWFQLFSHELARPCLVDGWTHLVYDQTAGTTIFLDTAIYWLISTSYIKGKVSASYFWPGSYIDDPERRPNFWLPYNATVPFQQRINQVVNWLLLPVSQRPSFIALYLDEPDSSGHDSGPESAKVSPSTSYCWLSHIQWLLYKSRISGRRKCSTSR